MRCGNVTTEELPEMESQLEDFIQTAIADGSIVLFPCSLSPPLGLSASFPHSNLRQQQYNAHQSHNPLRVQPFRILAADSTPKIRLRTRHL